MTVPRAVLIRSAIAVAVLAALWCAPLAAGIPVCGFHWLTSRPCPLCGMTRALAALLHGHWSEALRLHALSPLALPLILAVILGAPGRKIPWRALALLFGAYGLARIAAGMP